MDREKIESLVKSGESELLEFKKTTGERKEAARTICAMLNARGGKVFFGIEPNGKVIGQNVSDHTIEEIAQELRLIEPAILPTIDRVSVKENHEVIVVTILIGDDQPYTYKGEAFKRVGNTNQPMSRYEYNRVLMERMHPVKRWETEVAEDWTIKDLDQELIIGTLNEAVRQGRAVSPKNPDPLEILRGFGLVKDNKLLRAAIVLFAKDEKAGEWPQLILKVARFRGTDKTEFLDNRQFYGNAFYLLQMAERFWLENMPIAGKIVPNQLARIDKPLYPPIALREALANAICHRDYTIAGGSISVGIYSDRLEITSGGSLHFGITPNDLLKPHESKPWNPLIANVFYRRGMIEVWGRGTLKIFEEAKGAGLVTPTISEIAGSVVVCFRSRPETPDDLTEIQNAILILLRESKDGLANREIVKQLAEIDRRRLKDELSVLREKGLADYIGKGAGIRWKSM